MELKALDFISLSFRPNDKAPPQSIIKVMNETTGEIIREIPPSSKGNIVDLYV